MTYASGAAFRRALEDRLRRHSLEEGEPLFWLRKMVAFDRYLARLVAGQSDEWLLKGGMALQLRLGERARTTKDLDVLVKAPQPSLHQTLVQAALLDLNDWFSFEVRGPTSDAEEAPGAGHRFPVTAMLDGRRFEQFHLDVGIGNPVIGSPVPRVTLPLLRFADIEPTTILCYPIAQHVAEKVHAYTRPHPTGVNTRVKDLVDILLLAENEAFVQTELGDAMDATFSYWGTHPLPVSVPPPPKSWATPFRRMAKDIGLLHGSLDEATVALQSFINPVLKSRERRLWNAAIWSWELVDNED